MTNLNEVKIGSIVKNKMFGVGVVIKILRNGMFVVYPKRGERTSSFEYTTLICP